MPVRPIPSLAALALCSCAASQRAAEIPQSLAAPAGHALRLKATAKGAQVYTCQAKADKQGFEWAFTAPEAELFDEGGKKIGTHFAGPTWQLEDGGKLTGAVKEKAPAPSADSIPWLLLEVKSSQGAGRLAGVTHIQRVDTNGGKAPEGGCSEARQGEVAKVDYTATYLFHAAQ
jgi:hypothetical protein